MTRTHTPGPHNLMFVRVRVSVLSPSWGHIADQWPNLDKSPEFSRFLVNSETLAAQTEQSVVLFAVALRRSSCTI